MMGAPIRIRPLTGRTRAARCRLCAATFGPCRRLGAALRLVEGNLLACRVPGRSRTILVPAWITALIARSAEAPGLPIGLTTRETGTLAPFVVSVGRLEREGA